MILVPVCIYIGNAIIITPELIHMTDDFHVMEPCLSRDRPDYIANESFNGILDT